MNNCVKTFELFLILGKFSHKIESGHLIVPRRVHANGTHLTYNVTHYHQPNDLDETKSDLSGEKIYYHFELHDGPIHVELSPSDDFIGSSMVIERHRRDTRSRTKYRRQNKRCHFQGHVRNDHTSSVALSACDGIVSILVNFVVNFCLRVFLKYLLFVPRMVYLEQNAATITLNRRNIIE